MRQRYLVTYDICDPKRLRKVFEIMRGFGDHLQLSVFRCDLTDVALATLKARLIEVIDSAKDQVLFIDVGPAEGRGEVAFESIGRPYQERPKRANVV